MKKEFHSTEESKKLLSASKPKYISLADENGNSIIPFNKNEKDSRKQLSMIFSKLESDPFLKNGIFLIKCRDSNHATGKIFSVKIKQGEPENSFAESQPKKEVEKKNVEFSSHASIVTQSEWLQMIKELMELRIENTDLKKKVIELEADLSEVDAETKEPGFFERPENVEKFTPFIERGLDLLENFFSARTKGTTVKNPVKSTTVKPWIKPNPLHKPQQQQTPFEFVRGQQQQQQQQQQPQQPDVNSDEENIQQLTFEVINLAGNNPEKIAEVMQQVTAIYPMYADEVEARVTAFYSSQNNQSNDE